MQYHHIINSIKSATLVVDVPSKNQLNHILQPKHTKYLLLNVGYTLLHPNDRYVRKTGREESLKRLKPETFTIKQVTFNESSTIFVLKPIDETFAIKELTFMVNSSYDKVYFIEGKI